MATCKACHCVLADDNPWYMGYGMCGACVQDVPDELRDPHEKCICPVCNSECELSEIQTMSCCLKCAHRAGDC